MKRLKIEHCILFLTSLIFLPIQSTSIIDKETKDLNLILSRKGDTDDGPLFLTPLIKAHKIVEAQEKSKVKFESFENVVSYSGFLTVNPKYNSNLFFWFFPSELQPETSPLLLWLNGGPGSSSLNGLFLENGPFATCPPPKQIKRRSIYWSKTYSVIYVDSPVGSGFSFEEAHGKGYARTEQDVARDLFEALNQFYQLFPDYKSHDFYITGQSFAGMYGTALARKIHLENQKLTVSHKINLKGMAMGNAWMDPISTTHFGSYLYNLGLIDYKARLYFHKEEIKARQFIRQKKYVEAFKVMNPLVIGAFIKSPSLLTKLTGIDTTVNFLHQEDPYGTKSMEMYLQDNLVRKAIHVGNTTFRNNFKESLVGEKLIKVYYKSVKPWLEELLNTPEGYKFLFYNGQLDITCPPVFADKFIRRLKWNGAEEFSKTKRIIWYCSEKSKHHENIAGYVKSSGGLTQVVVRNAGHLVPSDAPRCAYDMIGRFIEGRSFAD